MKRHRPGRPRETARMFADAPPNTVRMEAVVYAGDGDTLTDTIAALLFGGAWGAALAIAGWFGFQNGAAAAIGLAIGLLGGSGLRLGVIAWLRSQKDIAEFAPPQPAPPPSLPARFIDTTAGDMPNQRTLTELPAGFDADLWRRWSAECVRKEYKMTFTAWTGRDGLLDRYSQFEPLLDWLEIKGYGSKDGRGELHVNDTGKARILRWAAGDLSVI